MSIQRNMNDGNLSAWMRKVDRFMNSSPLNHSSIGRGGIEVYDGGWIRILNGGLEVIGTATVSGVLDVTGTFNASGTNNLSGDNNLTGPTTVAGDFEIIAGGIFKAGGTTINPDGSAQFGALAIGADGKLTAGLFTLNPDGSAAFGTLGIASDGTLTVRNDINVEAGGKIKAGNLEIEPANGGQINFTGGSLSAGSFGALLNNTTAVELQAPTIKLNTSNVNINSLPSKPASELTPVGIDSAGRLHRIA
ncbi:hypothetical protein ATK23_1446 [Glutamicibacter mysorens]|uniref:Autotransporter-associated beta strand protein n=1 Tax=Glutamicibacter mysorens TaxID=257984 RepID=A0ABX4MXY3_9MICC|nr:hypothetical protein [Glutamicibacter mysorens]PJJ44218.1 hypothetical protein ATK23_1446 [Glutamicibacter mysorens]